MIVVLIISITAALALPALVSAMAERRTGQASLDLVRLARRARGEALGYGRAHLVRYTQTDRTGGASGRARLFRGLGSSCRSQPGGWNAILGGPACGALGSMCVDDVDLSNYTFGSQTVQLRPVGLAVAVVDICFTPSGTVYWRTDPGGVFTDRNTNGGGVRFSVTRLLGGAPMGVARQVLFPIGGTPRVFR